MKKINIIFILGFIIAFSGCEHSSKTTGVKTETATQPTDTGLQIIPVSQQTAPQDTQQLQSQRTEQGKKYLRNNWMNVIHIKKGAYKTGKNNTGISNLTIEADNTSIYPIDSIKILIPYWAHSECIKSEYVKLKNIPAEGKAVVNVPGNKDATSFQVQVRKVNSAALHLCFDIDDPNREGDDPFRCK